MFHGRLRDGRLTDISARQPTFPDDVPLDEMPLLLGPLTYDPATRTAIALRPERRSVEQRIFAAGLTPLHAALVLRSSPGWVGLPESTKSWVERTLDEATTTALGAIG